MTNPILKTILSPEPQPISMAEIQELKNAIAPLCQPEDKPSRIPMRIQYAPKTVSTESELEGRL
jgi:hypothetical protein